MTFIQRHMPAGLSPLWGRERWLLCSLAHLKAPGELIVMLGHPSSVVRQHL